MQTTYMPTWIDSHLLRGPAATKHTEQLSLWIFGWREMSSLGHGWRVSAILLLKKTWGLSFMNSFYIKTSGRKSFSVFPLLSLPSHWVSMASAGSWVLRKDNPEGKIHTVFFQKIQGCEAASYQCGSKRLSLISHVLLYLPQKTRLESWQTWESRTST